MNIDLTGRAREKGMKEVKIMELNETEEYIACVLYEKRIKHSDRVEWLDPTIIFKTPVKHGIYDQAVRLAESAGLVLFLPDVDNFRTDYYGLSFNGHKSIVKSWGYTSNHLPISKRWNKSEMDANAKKWLPDINAVAQIVCSLIEIVQTTSDENIRLELAKQYLENFQVA